MLIKVLIFNSFYFGAGVVIFERTEFVTVSYLGRCGGYE